MAKSKPYLNKTPPATPPQSSGEADSPAPAVSDPVPPTCEGCHFWTPSKDAGVGECRFFPPSRPTGKFEAFGQLLAYPLTLVSTPACGQFKAR